MFDDISYGKGASVLRMFESFVGDEFFRRGVVSYLKSFSFSNARGFDFWSSISSSYGSNINDVVSDWITKQGYPIIFVDIRDSSIEFRQRRFTLLENNDNTIYKVPLTFETNGKFSTLLMKESYYKLSVEGGIETIKVNVNRSGFYRVFYSSLEPVFKANLNRYEELGLVNDYWNFVLAGLFKVDQYLNIVKKYEYTKNSFLTSEIVSELLTLYNINKNKYYDAIREFLTNQVKIYKDLKDDLSKMAYSTLMSSLASIDEDFALGLSYLFQENDKLDSNIKEAVAIAYGVATSDFSTLLNKYISANIDEERYRFLKGMVAIRDKSVVEKIIELIFNRTIKFQDARFVFSLLAHNPFVREEICNFIIDNSEKVKEFVNSIGGGPWVFGYLLRGTMTMCGIDKPKEILEFLERIKYKEIERQVKSTEELIQVYSKLK
ncbi:hypothetical protein DJ522_05100 [Sulfolobus sp. F3]|nr:hypothetical protein DJ522_05100 [Sulfolobus sp. F3]